MAEELQLNRRSIQRDGDRTRWIANTSGVQRFVTLPTAVLDLVKRRTSIRADVGERTVEDLVEFAARRRFVDDPYSFEIKLTADDFE